MLFFPRIAWNHWTNIMLGVITCHNHHLQCAEGMKQNIAKTQQGLTSCNHTKLQVWTISEDQGKLSKKTEDGTQTLVLCGHVFFFSKIPFGSIYCFRECHVFLPMASILNFIIFTVSEVWKSSSKGRSSQVAVSQTGVHLSICSLWSSEVVKRVRHNLPNQSKLLEGEHAKRFMKPLSSPGSWGMICQSSKLHICHWFFEFCHPKFLWHPFSYETTLQQSTYILNDLSWWKL